jgi:chromosome segregation ATPase
VAATIEATTAATSPQAAYDEARERLQSLVSEEAGIDHLIRRTALSGDEAGAMAAATRKSVLPFLIQGARRATLEREREMIAAQVAEARAGLEELHPRAQEAMAALERAREALREAEQEFARTRSEAMPFQATIQNAQIRTQEIDRELARLPGAADAPAARTEVGLAAESSPGLGAPRPIGAAS